VVAAANEEQWENFCRAAGMHGWIRDPRFLTNLDRLDHVFELQEEIEHWAKDFTTKEILEKLEKNRVACGPVQGIKELVNDPHLQARKFFLEVNHPVIGKVILPGNPYKFSETPLAKPIPSPGLGEHNEYILTQYLGRSKEEVSQLYAQGVL
jgi:crotonobetainyl-CoA:carnitine CoA-transferase CaiB-like acyl-CoA transferase